MSVRLLVVDDSPVMRSAIQRAVNLSEVQVETAENGKAALSVLEDHPVDLMLLDLNMPVMCGDEMVRWMQQDPSKPQVPFIVVSEDATATRMQEMLDLGALAFIPKPFLPSALQSEVARAVERIHAVN
jgi:two-component system chemotaxis response regulator CheY